MARIGAAMLALTLAVSVTACAPETAIEDPGPPQVDAALPADMRAQLQAATEEMMAATGSPGAIVGVWAPWAGTWVAGIGTETPGGSAVDVDKPFKIGAITRAMTCDVLYRVVERGTVELDDTVEEWLPAYPNAAGITLGQLCDGTSGLGNYAGQVSNRWIANPERIWNPRELAAYGLALDRSFAPGTSFRDSDTAYLLLGLVLARATGTSMHDLYEQLVFDPLGLTSMSLPETARTDGTWLTGLRSATTDAEGCADPADMTALSPTAGSTAGGVVGNIHDLGRYVRALAAGARSYDTAERFDSAYTLTNQPAWFTASGGTYQAGSLVGQFSSIPGYLTAAFADRETGLTVAVVLNNSRASFSMVRFLAWKLAAIASKAPAAAGETAPEAGLPWTADTFDADIAQGAICPVE